MVYVISKQNKPLMPCKDVIARLLLKQGKAKVKRRIPFTIKLTYDSKQYIQALTHGIDTGSRYIGSAVVNGKNEVIYISEIEIRNDISEKMTERSKYRRNRRSRKTRYRKARWLNRKNSIKNNRFSPTMTSKINSHLKEINFVKSILPIKQLVLETGTFDPHFMKDNTLKYKKWGYQKGSNYGFANTKAKVLNRDNYTCQNCKTKKGTMEVHHIIYRSNGGSDEETNLITLCRKCHDDIHKGKIVKNLKGKVKGTLKYATQMNSIRMSLLKQLDCEETFGFITKENRMRMNLPKEHYIDSAVIASEGKNIKFVINKVLYKKCIADGDFQQTKGIRSEQKIPTCKIQGFRKFDKVYYLSKEYFIKGRMSSGYAILMDIFGNKTDFSNAKKGMKTPKLKNCKRIGARKSWIMLEKVIPNIA